MLEKLIPPQFRIAAYLVAGLAILGAGYWVYDTIYDRGYDARGVVAEQEKEAMRKANAAAVAAAEKGLREDVAALVLKIEELENANDLLDQEADHDADSGNVGIKRSGVQRLNAIR